MCHAPFMRRCVRRCRSPEKSMMRFLPFATTRSIVRPATSTRASCANTLSNFVTRLPASAACNVRATRWMVSPSGIVYELQSCTVTQLQREASHLYATLQLCNYATTVSPSNPLLDLRPQHAQRHFRAAAEVQRLV